MADNPSGPDNEAKQPVAPNPTWERVLLARHPKRPHTLDYVSRLFTKFSELHGDRAFGDDPAVVGGMALFDDRPVMVIGQQKGRDTKQKLMYLADKFRRPIVNFLDTPGAYPGVDAEERGQAEAIAVNLREMSRLRVPVIAIVIGEGGSGGALGLGIANRVYMLENAYYSVITPESCAAIIYRDSGKAPEAARALRLASADLLSFKLIDGVIAEPAEGAHTDTDKAAEFVRETLRSALAELSRMSPQELIDDRYNKFRRMGNFFAEGKSA
jgi:acetyl-CoA carboxylase carboxyl transferase subunit alpha